MELKGGKCLFNYPLPSDSRVAFLFVIVAFLAKKCIVTRVFNQINTVCYNLKVLVVAMPSISSKINVFNAQGFNCPRINYGWGRMNAIFEESSTTKEEPVENKQEYLANLLRTRR